MAGILYLPEKETEEEEEQEGWLKKHAKQAGSGVLESPGVYGDLAQLLAPLGLAGLAGPLLEKYLPTTQSISQRFGLPEPEEDSSSQNFVRKFSRMAGGSRLLGQAALTPANLYASAAGTAAKRAGAGEFGQAGAELVGGGLAGILTGKGKPPATTGAKDTTLNERLRKGREAGLSEETLTVAKNAEEGSKTAKWFAKGGERINKAIDRSREDIEKAVQSVKKNGLAEISEKALADLQKEENAVYGAVIDRGKGLEIPIENRTRAANKFQVKLDELKYSIESDETRKAAVGIVEHAISELKNPQPIDAAYVLNGFRDLSSKAAKLDDKIMARGIISTTKSIYKDMIRDLGSEGKSLIEAFEETNKNKSRLFAVRDAKEVFDSFYTYEGEFLPKVLYRTLDDLDSRKVLQRAIGEKGLEQLETIATLSGNVEDVAKVVGSNSPKGPNYLLYAAASAAYALDPRPLIAVLGYEGAKVFSQRVLTDPKFQNITIKLARAIKEGSRPAAIHLAQELVDLSGISDTEKKQKGRGILVPPA